VNFLEILKSAQHNKYAIGSFNFSTAEILKAIVLAAKELNSPVIVSTSEGEAEFIGMREAAALIRAWRAATKLPIVLNLDHGKSLKSIKKALATGYDMIHFDGSGLDYKKNIEETKKVIDFARDFGKTFDKRIIIEGELGYLRGASSVHKEKLEIQPEDLTDPKQAEEFIEKTGIDSLAMVIGNAHGIFLQSEEKLNLERLAEIKKKIGDRAFLVLHGGSGISENDIKKAVELGVVKINVNTELRVAYKEAMAKELAGAPEETTPYKILEPSLEAVKKVVEEKIKLFGSENRILVK
jgi:fructose-bisphosphate aldolase class II